MPSLAAIELDEDAAALGWVIDERQGMERFIDSTELGNALRQARRTLAHLQRAHDAGGSHPA
jgi:hypothetical protein